WRTGCDRSIHLFWRSEMGTTVRAGHAAATWLRGPGSGAFISTIGTVPATLRGIQYSGMHPLDASTSLSFITQANAPAAPQTADHHVAQKHAASQGSGLFPGRAGRWPLPGNHSRNGSA